MSMSDLISTLPVVTTAILGIVALFKDYQHDRSGRKVTWLTKSGVIMLVLIIVTMAASLYAVSQDKAESENLTKEVRLTRSEATLARNEARERDERQMKMLEGVLVATGHMKFPDGDFLSDPKNHSSSRGEDLSYKTLDLEAVAREYTRLRAKLQAPENSR